MITVIHVSYNVIFSRRKPPCMYGTQKGRGKYPKVSVTSCMRRKQLSSQTSALELSRGHVAGIQHMIYTLFLTTTAPYQEVKTHQNPKLQRWKAGIWDKLNTFAHASDAQMSLCSIYTALLQDLYSHIWFYPSSAYQDAISPICNKKEQGTVYGKWLYQVQFPVGKGAELIQHVIHYASTHPIQLPAVTVPVPAFLPEDFLTLHN